MSHSPSDPYSTSNEGDYNPFAPPESLDESGNPASANNSESQGELQKIPPVEASYGYAIGFLILGLFLTGFIGAPVAPFSIAILGLPFAIIRLFLHRSSIARAIRDGRYPGGVRFNYVYFIVSIVLGVFCVFAGILVFFLVCTVVIYSIADRTPYGPIGALDEAGPWFLGVNALLAFFTSLALNRLSVPRYQ
jgi:hypothetical protein